MKHIANNAQRITFWVSLLVLAISSVLLDFVLMFLMLLIDPLLLYSFVLLMGLFFGFIFSFLVMDLYHLEKKHHVFLSIFVPALALLNIYLILVGATSLSQKLGIGVSSSPIVVSFFLLFGYTLPYLFFGLTALFKKK